MRFQTQTPDESNATDEGDAGCHRGTAHVDSRVPCSGAVDPMYLGMYLQLQVSNTFKYMNTLAQTKYIKYVFAK